MEQNIAVYGASFNPPGLHHREVVQRLAETFDQVIVVPCGERDDKPPTNAIDPVHRAAMVDLNFGGIPKVRVDLFDLETPSFTRTHLLDQRFRPEGRVWHVVGDDLVRGGGRQQSVIHRTWFDGPNLWNTLPFAVYQKPGTDLDSSDLPPWVQNLGIEHPGSSPLIRDRIHDKLPVGDLIHPAVNRYLQRHHLYQFVRTDRLTKLKVGNLRCRIVFDPRNQAACQVAESLKSFVHDDPELIVVIGGDGTMLRAIREHWRSRLPFFGINTGHLGFLLNGSTPPDFDNQELNLYPMPMLRVDVESIEGKKSSSLAFNDAWVERATGQTAWLNLQVDRQERISKIVADGMLVATAAGSTSYARAMGAAPMPLNTKALLMVGSNVLTPSSWKPTMMPLTSEVVITTIDPDKRPLQGYIDGVSQGKVQSMSIRVSQIAAIELAFLPSHDPIRKLYAIQFPENFRDHSDSPR